MTSPITSPRAPDLFMWFDVFVHVDHGRGVPADYPAVSEAVLRQAREHTRGVAGLVIIPAHAAPPSEGARGAMNEAIARLGSAIVCVCWLVEGGGFHAAMVRAVLTGVKMFGRASYDTHIATEMEAALRWTLRRLDGGDARLGSVPAAIRFIEEARRRADLAYAPPV